MSKLIKYISKINKSKIKYKSEITIIDRIIEKTFLRIIPEKITPNQLTKTRFISVPFLIIFLLLGQYSLGIVLFILSAFTDVLDGAIARTRNKITSWGAIYDPIADKLLIGSVSIILVSKFISLYLGILIIVIEITLIVLTLYCFKGEIPPAKTFGKLKGLSYSLGIIILTTHIIFTRNELLIISQVFIYLGIVFALISPIPYIKILKVQRENKKDSNKKSKQFLKTNLSSTK